MERKVFRRRLCCILDAEYQVCPPRPIGWSKQDLGSVSAIAYLIHGYEVDAVIDGELLIVSPVDSGELDILVVHGCGTCLRIPR